MPAQRRGLRGARFPQHGSSSAARGSGDGSAVGVGATQTRGTSWGVWRGESCSGALLNPNFGLRRAS